MFLIDELNTPDVKQTITEKPYYINLQPIKINNPFTLLRWVMLTTGL